MTTADTPFIPDDFDYCRFRVEREGLVLTCIKAEDDPIHSRNLGDPGSGRNNWFVAPNHLFRGRDFGQTDWPAYTRINFRGSLSRRAA